MRASDAALLDRWAGQRDAEAFAELVARHSSMVYATCKRILHNDADAQDVAQECFIGLAQLASRGSRVRSSLNGWLHTAATHRALDRLKTEKRRRRWETKFAEETPGNLEPGSFDDVQEHVDEAIASLAQKLREPIVSHFLEGQSHQAIADTLGIPRRTVTSRITKGIEEVRKALKRRGIPITTSALASLLTVEAAEAAPAALTAALGRIALTAGHGALASGSAAPHISTFVSLGGVIMSAKKIAACIVVVLALAAGVYVLPRALHRSAETTPREVAPSSRQTTDTQAEARDDESLGPDQVAAVPAELEKLSGDESAEEASDTLLSIAGHVVDPDGGPVVGTAVTAKASGDVLGAVAETLTDSGGRFELSGLSAGAYAIEAFKAGHGLGRAANVQAGSTDVGITLEAVGRISGHIYNQARGEALAGAKVYLLLESSYRIQAETSSDAQGAYLFGGIKPTWVYVLRAAYDGLATTDSEPISMRNVEDMPGVDVYLGEGHTLSGKVLDLIGSGVGDAQVFLSRYDEHLSWDPTSNLVATTRRDGSFSISHVAAGKYWPNVLMPDTMNIELADGFTMPADSDLHDLIIVTTLGQDGFVSGVVTDSEGNPIQNVIIDYVSGTSGGSIRTKDDGSYLLKGLDNVQAVHIEVKGGRVGYGRETRVVPVNSENVDFILAKNGAVKGRVVDGVTREAIQKFEVACGGWGTWREFKSPDGTFAIDGIEFEEITLEARAEGYAYAKTPLIVPPGETVEGVTIALLKGIELTGTVIDAGSGEGVPDARVKPFDGWIRTDAFDYEPWWGPRAAIADAQGRFRLGDISPGQAVNLVAYHKGCAAAFLMGVAAEPGVEVTLELGSGGVLRGVAYDGSEPLVNGIFLVKLHSLPASTPESFEYMARAISTASGEFEVANLPEGRYTVACVRGVNERNADIAWFDWVEISAGQALELEVQLATTGSLIGQVTGSSENTPVDVHVISPTLPEEPYYSVRCEEDGRFEITGLLAGTYTVRAQQGEAEVERAVVLSPGEERDVALGF